MLRDGSVDIEARWDGVEMGRGHDERCESVHRQLKRIVKARGALDAQEGEALLEADRLGVWRWYGYGSLPEYMEMELGYTPRAAVERIRVAKAIIELPAIGEAMSQGELSFSAARELTRVATAETEGAWLEAAHDKNLRDIEQLVSGHKKGDGPDDPPDPTLRKRVLRYDEIDEETVALMRQARQILDRELGERLDNNQFLRALGRTVIDAASAAREVRARTGAPYQIAVTTCDQCKRAWQDGGGITVEMSAAKRAVSECDAQHIGRVDSDSAASTNHPGAGVPKMLRGPKAPGGADEVLGAARAQPRPSATETSEVSQQPSGMQPGGMQPRGTQPGGTQPGETQPGGTQPGETQPGGTQPGGTQPGGMQPRGTQPGGTQPGETQPGGTQPGETQPGGTQPGETQPGGMQPGGMQPRGTQPGGTQPGGTQPGGTQPGGTQPGGTQLGETQPGGIQPGRAQPGVVRASSGTSARTTIPPALRRKVNARDHGRCRVPWCRSSRNIDQHHIQPISEGGEHTLENLITLCESHHIALHEGALALEGAASSARFTRRAQSDFEAAVHATETVKALRTLGFRKNEVAAAIEKTRAHVGTAQLTLEQWIRIALSYCPRPVG